MDKRVLMIAAVVYAANAAYCKSIGDHSFDGVDFDNAPEWQKETNVKGVEFRLANPQSTPEQSHESWLKEKAEKGWVYGPVKDAEKKTHPCIMPYSGLPAEQRKKDSLFIGIVDALK